MKIILTGTHFTPAQSVIEELLKQGYKDLIYIGRKRTREGDNSLSIESKVLPKLGVKFIPIVSGRISRHFSFWSIVSFLKIPIGFIQAFYILFIEQPDVIVSFGGYTAVPVVFCGWLLSVPILIHEQTLIPGLSSRVTSHFADKIALSFDESKKYYKESKTVVTGNPLRQEIIHPTKEISSELDTFIKKANNKKAKIIFITGGNQGSHIINQTISEILGDLLKDYFVIHQTGDSKFKDFDSLSSQKEQMKAENYYIAKWLGVNDFANVLKNTSLVVSRAGINTLLELSYFQVPSIIIPLPKTSRNEQVKNAKYFEKLGVSEVVYQEGENISKDILLKKIKEIIKENIKYKNNAVSASKLIKADADKSLTLEIITLSQNG